MRIAIAVILSCLYLCGCANVPLGQGNITVNNTGDNNTISLSPMIQEGQK